MSNWNHNVTFIVSVSQQLTAKRISRALDPDVGGFDAFETYASATGVEPATYVIYGTPCRDEFLMQLDTLMGSASTLKSALDADYAVRWPGEAVPTLAECEAFLADLQVFVDRQLDEVLSQAGLKIINYVGS